MGRDAPAPGHPAIRRAMNAIVKRGLFVQRQKMFISRPFVRNMVAAIQRGDEVGGFAPAQVLT